MKRYSTVEAAVELVINNLEANHIASDTNSIRKQVYSWYEHSDVTDPEMIAACVLEGKEWFAGATYQYMEDLRDWWFPQVVACNNEISIWEIEEAQHDSFWW